MARSSIPLMVPPGPAPMASGVELYVVESHNQFAGTVEGSSPGEHDSRSINVLISFATSDADRSRLWPLRSSLSFGHFRSAIVDGADWTRQLYEQLSTIEPACVTATIYVPSEPAVPARDVQAVLDLLHEKFGWTLAVVVVVAPACERFKTQTGASGFVRGAVDTSGETARQTFLLLSGKSAPIQLNCVDFEETLAALGPATSPSWRIQISDANVRSRRNRSGPGRSIETRAVG